MPLDSPARHPPGSPRLEARLRRDVKVEGLFDPFSRGRYSTDASIYQIEPLGVAVPKNREDIAAALAIAREEGVPVLPRGGGTSQCGQTVARALVLDCSKYMDGVVTLDVAARRVRVQPGVVLERLNASLRRTKLFYPVDVSTGDRATIGGMTANNSCGARSIRYGNMVHNVRAIDAILADGSAARFAEVPGNFGEEVVPERYRGLVRDMRALHRREADEIDRRFPKLLRRVGGYNIDMISDSGHNMAHLLVGSEGTLGFFTEIELDLQPIPPHRVLGICHFPSFYGAMDATQHIVKLGRVHRSVEAREMADAEDPVGRDRLQVQFDLGEEAERPFRADQQMRHVVAAVGDHVDVVAADPAQQFREAAVDLVGLAAMQGAHVTHQAAIALGHYLLAEIAGHLGEARGAAVGQDRVDRADV